MKTLKIRAFAAFMSKPRLYPPATPFASGWLPPHEGHRIFWQQSGRVDGLPVVILHGGPGGGSVPIQRQFFDPSVYRIIQFDQRGCGRSTPLGLLEANAPDTLVADMERLREVLKIDRWVLFGGSWGSTLALLYGQAHPLRCLGFILRGIFLMRRREVAWFFDGMGRLFPEAKARFASLFPTRDSQGLLPAYYAALTGEDRAAAQRAGAEWVRYESACSCFQPVINPAGPANHDAQWAMALIEAHYFLHHLFDPDDRLLKGARLLEGKPARLVHGRYDAVCPAETAWALHQAWPGSSLKILPDAGHSSLEPAMMAALIEATEDFKSLR